MPSVLVTDDNVALAANLEEILCEEGYDVTTVHTPEEALQVAQRKSFDYVLLDVRLPGMDGVTLHGLLSQRMPNAVFVLMTAYTTDDRLEAARRAGVRDILPKPIPIRRLLDALGQGHEGIERILVVDDDVELGTFLLETLAAHGYRTEWVGTARDARARLLLGEHDAVVLDVKLPDGDGVALATELVLGHALPVVVISGFELGVIETRLRAAHYERVVFLPKPFTPDRLFSAIHSLGTPR